MKTLITVDLDYWTNCYKRTNREAIWFLKEVIKSSTKSYLVWLHHHILDLIPRGTKRIINIDFHNDIVGEHLDINEEPDSLNEGTWGNFLPSSVEVFDWIYPSKQKCIIEGYGICLDSDGNPSSNYPVEYHAHRNWKTIDFHSAHTFVLCVSPHWALEHDYVDYLDGLGIHAKNTSNIIKI